MSVRACGIVLKVEQGGETQVSGDCGDLLLQLCSEDSRWERLPKKKKTKGKGIPLFLRVTSFYVEKVCETLANSSIDALFL